jgi:tetratricopeptide (TPR) repeat protein
VVREAGAVPDPVRRAGAAPAGSAGVGSAAIRGAADAGASDAGRAGHAGAGSAARPDRAAEARALCDQASGAIDEGDFARAFDLAVASLKLRKTARAYMVRARAEQRLNRIADALTSLDAATEIAPTYGPVWEQRGRILWAARRRDEARAAFSRFLELDPRSSRAAEVLRLLDEPR